MKISIYVCILIDIFNCLCIRQSDKHLYDSFHHAHVPSSTCYYKYTGIFSPIHGYIYIFFRKVSATVSLYLIYSVHVLCMTSQTVTHLLVRRHFKGDNSVYEQDRALLRITSHLTFLFKIVYIYIQCLQNKTCFYYTSYLFSSLVGQLTRQ